MSWGLVAIGVGSAVAGYTGSKAQEKAADRQAEGITQAQAISNKRAEEARASALALFEPTFADISTSLNQARDDLLSGRVSSQDVLNQAFSQADSTLQTSNQQAMNAILGTPSQQPMAAQPRAEVQPRRIGKSQRRPMQSKQNRMPQQFSGINSPTKNGVYLGSHMAGQANNTLPNNGASKGNRMLDPGDPRNFGNMGPFESGDPRGNNANYSNGQYVEPSASLQNMEALEGELTPSNMNNSRFRNQAPQGRYGLAGAESALRESMRGQVDSLNQGAQDAVSSVRRGFGTARNDISEGLDSGLSALRQGVETGRDDIMSSSQNAISRFEPYAQAGQGALEMEAALSGAMGPEAQAEAFANYNESPGQAYARQQQEKALLRNSAAIGGLGGGNVRSALQEQAAGIASQNYQQDLDNLRSLAGRGQQAAGNQAGIETQAGQNMANLAMTGGQTELNAQQGASSQLAQLAAQSGMTEGQIQQMLGQNLSNVYGANGANVSNLRYGAGQDIARQLGSTGQQLAQLQSGQGTALANIDQQTAANLSNLAAQQGQQTSGLRTSLASLLANLATGQGTQQANLATQMGNARAAGVTNPFGNAASSFTGLLASNPELISNLRSGGGNNTANIGMV